MLCPSSPFGLVIGKALENLSDYPPLGGYVTLLRNLAVTLYEVTLRILIRQTISDYIVNRPIFEHCRSGVRQHGSSPRMFWWDQPMHLDEEAPDGAPNSDSNAGKE